MTPNSNPNDDPRTTAELVSVALTETDEEIAWDAVRALHWRGGLDVLERAKQLTDSICSGERRLGADNFDTRGEALVGLAQRKDVRVIAALKRELESDCIGCLAMEAAEMIASSELYPLLVDLRGWWDIDIDLLERAIEASKK